MTTTVAYLLALATVVLLLRVFQGFERRPVDRPVKRWVMVATGPQRPESSRNRPIPRQRLRTKTKTRQHSHE